MLTNAHQDAEVSPPCSESRGHREAGNRPHICFVGLHAYPVLADDRKSPVLGGAEVQQAIIAKGLVARGYRVSMVTMDYGQEDQVNIGGVSVYKCYKPDEGVPVVRFVWPRLIKLWKCLTRVGADVYYQRTAGVTTGVVAAFCRQKGKKSIYAAAGTPSLERYTRRVPNLRDRLIYEYGVRNVDKVLVQNEEQAELCLKNFGRESTLIGSCYEPAGIWLRDRPREVLWVGTIRQVKRPDLFLALARSHPEIQFRMIGGPASGDASLYKRIQADAARIHNVIFMGFVPYLEADMYFNSAAVLVNTSDSEGFPNTFLQAWARGVPTISFVDCGARENGEPIGRIVRTLEEMSFTISRLLSDDQLRMDQGETCRHYFQAHHSRDGILDLYEQVFSELGGHADS